MTLAELRARLEAIQAERRDIHTAAGEAALTEERQTRWDALDVEENELRDQERDHPEARAARVAESRARWRSTEFVQPVPPAGGVDVRALAPREVRDRAMATMEDRETGGHLADEQRARVERLLRVRSGDLDGETLGRLLLATEDPNYRSAFQEFSSTDTPIFTREQAVAVRQVRAVRAAMAIGSDGTGGFAVPVLIDPTIIMTGQGSPNDILRLARVETITNNVWRGLSSAGVTWKFRAEATATTSGAPTVAQPAITTRRADGFIDFSIEVSMDWASFAENMVDMLGEGYSEILADKLTIGTNGSDEPDGLVSSLDAQATIEHEVASAGVITAADVYALWDLLPQKWRRAQNCAWMSSTSVQNSIRQLGTVDPNFTINMTVEAIPRFFGREFPMNDYMQDDPAGTGTQALLVVGDFRQYLVAQRAGMTVEFIPHLFDATNNMPTGQRGYFGWVRVGGGLLTKEAFRLLVNRSA